MPYSMAASYASSSAAAKSILRSSMRTFPPSFLRGPFKSSNASWTELFFSLSSSSLVLSRSIRLFFLGLCFLGVLSELSSVSSSGVVSSVRVFSCLSSSVGAVCSSGASGSSKDISSEAGFVSAFFILFLCFFRFRFKSVLVHLF